MAIDKYSKVNGHSVTNGAVNGNATTNGSANGNFEDGTAEYGSSRQVPVAICGMGLRLPGGIRSDADLFDFLVNKGDARSIVPDDRFNIESYYDPNARPGFIGTKYGYFLHEDLSQFDTSMFGMIAAEVTQLDPAQRLLLEVTREALESAGEGDFRGKNIGTYVGDFTQDWEDLHAIDVSYLAPYLLTGKADFVLSNRLAYEYDLTGPSLTVKTACSASGQAMYEAILSIQSGGCPSAIVAGANLILTPRGSAGMSAYRVLAPDGSCKTFDAEANGYARGESVSAMYIKRLDDALRDGNPIRAVIRACGSNADGGGTGRSFGVPNPVTQERLIRQTYAQAGLDLASTGVVECHGTGTAVGDPLEVQGIANCFGGRGVYIGSVKPNLGHGEGASAMASIAKATLALEKRIILPNIKFNTPNPRIPFESANLKVPTEATPWPQNVPERISINSFGLGGSNVHLVLDSAASFGIPSPHVQPCNLPEIPRKSLLLFSANSAPALTKMVENHAQYLKKHPTKLESMAYTLASCRERLKLTSFCVVNGSTLSDPAPPAPNQGIRRVAFVFTGQGAQWVGMGKELIQEHAAFAESIRSMDKVLQSLKHPPEWTLQGTLLDSSEAISSALASTERAQPVCVALQIALVDLLATWEIRPAAVVGHSSGEIGAAYAAGVLTLREAIVTAYYRGYANAQCKLSGGMVAVGLGREQVRSHLISGVNIACENSSSSVTLSGDVVPLEKVMSALRENYPDALVRKLRVPLAYHSYHMKTVADSYNALIRPHLVPKTPQVPFYSTVYGTQVQDAAEFGPRYWQDNMENPVLFHTAASKMVVDLGQDVAHLELGPHSVLAGPLRDIYKETGQIVPYTSVLVRGKNTSEAFFESIGKLFCAGLKPRVPLSSHATALPDLPNYPWNYEATYWSETRIMADWRFRRHRPHELLGLRILENSDLEPAWRKMLKLADVPWLADHCVGKDIVFPAAGYMVMAGEAVSQLTDAKTYTLREVHIASAMLLTDNKTTEIVTTLRKKALTSTLDSKFHEFSIASYNNGQWIKHCWGLVVAGCASALPAPKVETYPRTVEARRWYKTMSRIGLNYGPRFTGLEDITTSVIHKTASLSVTDKQHEDESPYPLHPTTLDLILQSWAVASVGGEYRELVQLFLPTFVEEFYVGAGANKSIRVNTVATGVSGTALGNSYGVADGEIVYSLKGFKGSKVDNSIQKFRDLKALELQWHPDFDCGEIDKLMRPSGDSTADLEILERMYVLCAIEVQENLAGATCTQPHYDYYRSWLNRELTRYKQPALPLVPDSADLVAMSKGRRHQTIEELHERSKNTKVYPPVEAVRRVYARAVDIVEGRTGLLDVLLEDGLLAQFYDWFNDLSDIHDLFQVMGQSKPYLRVLEIGAGTGGTTARALSSLKSKSGERLYHSYTITDISAGFFAQCRERFKEEASIEYQVLDISKNPLEQGFEEEAYDLIIASNGLFDGWWLGIDDGRTERPCVAPEVWDAKLREAGFAGMHAVSFDNQLPYYNSANIVARPAVSSQESARITLLTASAKLGAFAEIAKRALEGAKYAVDHCIWGQKPPDGQDVISFIDIDEPGPLLKDVSPDDLAKFVQTVNDISQSALLWLTQPAQTTCQDANFGQILGAARTIRAELAMDFATLELEKTDANAAFAVIRVLRKIQRARKGPDGDVDNDMEYVWRNGEVLVGRFHSFRVLEALADDQPAPDAKHLVIAQRGMLQSLQWEGDYFQSLGPDEVRVRIAAVGMNFRDLAIAMGIVDTAQSLGAGFNQLGVEGAGFVTELGSNVQHLKVGDRVMTCGAGSGGYATECVRPAIYCVHIPESLSTEDAAGIVVPYATVLWSFVNKGNLKKGQSVLIHSAAGGVGIAAIHVARWIGLDIYVTVGSKEKADFLVQKLSVPRNRIFHSRDGRFEADIMNATNGKGVHAALNSLSGELLHATWRCVSPGGCLLEIGKRDLLGRGQLALHLFEENRAYFGIDISRLIETNMEDMADLLNLTMKLLEQGHIHPIHPTTVFDAEKVQDAFRYMQKGVHMGRIVVKMPQDDVLPLAPPLPKPSFKSDASYLLVGGLGGLGRSIISWMAAAGARDVMVLSRSAGKSDIDQAFIREIAEAGCALKCFAGDVTDGGFVQQVISAAAKPIAGVMQMAMVLRDVGFLSMDYTSWMDAIRPKIQGSWNLHQFLPADLDFFVLFGSESGTLSSYGQSNYAAANTYLDSFVNFRHNLCLPASVIDICAVGDVGYVSQQPAVAERMAEGIGRLMFEDEFLYGLQLAIARSSRNYATPDAPRTGNTQRNISQIVLHNETDRPLSDPQNAAPWRRDPRVAIHRNAHQASQRAEGQGSDTLRRFLATVAAEPQKLEQQSTATFLAQEISKRVSSFIMKGDTVIDITQSLASMGVDSLVAIELRNWWKQTFATDVSVLELNDGGSMENLGELAAQRLREKFAATKQ
ncbi:putative polyketide synthase [Lepidopterella palustris CBS 459.81]|uniref:Putative polyketide synthase n=1 Tax=Lepidopterella palustris CBS 459.81 TaxID=1314670 RepID=A0A8E2DZR1_9PEZI|nr:putative polyketide synthase [Lepidopterella palustris CBS 459.81]